MIIGTPKTLFSLRRRIRRAHLAHAMAAARAVLTVSQSLSEWRTQAMVNPNLCMHYV